jgi:hypothetical protein
LLIDFDKVAQAAQDVNDKYFQVLVAQRNAEGAPINVTRAVEYTGYAVQGVITALKDKKLYPDGFLQGMSQPKDDGDVSVTISVGAQ